MKLRNNILPDELLIQLPEEISTAASETIDIHSYVQNERV
jgi:hypothetical protein